MIKINLFSLACISVCLLFSFAIMTNQELASPENDTPLSFHFDEILFDEEDDQPYNNEFLATVGTNHITRKINPEDILFILLEIDAPTLLQTPFFLHTNILNQRNLPDQPIFEPDRADFPGRSVVGVSLFVRKTNRSNFTKNSTKLSSYLPLTEEIFISRLENAIGKIINIFPEQEFNIAKIFSLFENMTVEQRQAGIMLHGTKRWNRTTLRIMAPIYYLENNFSLTQSEQDAVADEFGTMDPEEEETFRKQHFISDQIGVGDTRIEIDQRVMKRPSFSLRCGAQATIPTAFTWGKGFLGSAFPKPSMFPFFNLEPIFEAIPTQSSQAFADALILFRDLFLDSFDRIAANLLDTKLGNNGHLGLGVYVRTSSPLASLINTPFAQHFKITNRASAEILLPATEKRFYINKINEQDFNKRNFTDESKAAENVAFLEEQAIERIFLRAFDTNILPGAIFRWTGAARYSKQRFGFTVGLDFWLQLQNKFRSINATPSIIKNLDIQKAIPPFADQLKIFGNFIFKHKTPLKTWFISLNADAILNNKGVGQDYSLMINFETSF